MKLKDVRSHYSLMAQDYIDQYDKKLKLSRFEYPANYNRLELILNLCKGLKARNVLDAGVGAGVPLLKVAKKTKAKNIHAFDYTQEMVDFCKDYLKNTNFKNTNVYKGSVEKRSSFKKAEVNGKIDIALMLGVMPHVKNDLIVLKNLQSVMSKKSRAFISFRNKLFNIFTLNRYSYEFFINDLLNITDKDSLDISKKNLKKFFNMKQPPVRRVNINGGTGYDLILSKMHNPLEIHELFKKAGFSEIKIHWYHLHSTIPQLQTKFKSKKSFYTSSLKLEHNNNWRGMFLASAFLVEAIN